MLTVFQCVTMEGWTDIMYIVSMNDYNTVHYTFPALPLDRPPTQPLTPILTPPSFNSPLESRPTVFYYLVVSPHTRNHFPHFPRPSSSFYLHSPLSYPPLTPLHTLSTFFSDVNNLTPATFFTHPFQLHSYKRQPYSFL